MLFAIEAGVVRGLAVLVLRELLGRIHELLPGPGLVSAGRGIGDLGVVEHLLVVVQKEDFVRAAVSDGLALVGESQGLERGFVRLVHAAHVRQEAGRRIADGHGLGHDAGIRQLLRRRHGIQLRFVVVAADGDHRYVDLVLGRVELVQGLLNVGGLGLGGVVPGHVGDLYLRGICRRSRQDKRDGA